MKGKFSKRVTELTKDEYERIMKGMTQEAENMDTEMLDQLLQRKKQVISLWPSGSRKDLQG